MANADPPQPAPRPSIGVLFKCCNVYTRIYMNHTGTSYAGHCPRCAARIEVPVPKRGGPSGRILPES